MKGVVYTLVIYILIILIFEIFIFSLNIGEKILEQKSQVDYKKEFIQNLDEIGQLLKKELKINLTSYRNGTDIILKVEDEGFPLEQIQNFQFNLSNLEQFLNDSQKIKKCKIGLNTILINQSGLKLITNFDLNYSQNNSNPSYDELKIKFGPAIDVKKIKMQINCSRPLNVSSINYVDWQTTGTEVFSNITFFDEIEQHNNGVYFSLNTQNNFSATYLDSSSYKIYAVHLDYNPTEDEIRFWSDPNSTYITPYNKENVTCKFKFQVELNSSTYNEISAQIPAIVNLSCKNIDYSGYLILFRK